MSVTSGCARLVGAGFAVALMGACGGSGETAEGDSGGGSNGGELGTGGDFSSGGGTSGGSPGLGGNEGGALPACTNSQELGGFVSCDEGYTHRMRVEACPISERAEMIGNPELCDGSRGYAPYEDRSCCVYDSDCDGALQYCRRLWYDAFEPDTSCTPGCQQDSDCDAGQICQCGDPMGTCVAADCTSDAACDGESRCSSWKTSAESSCTTLRGYLCQTESDECGGPNDCPPFHDCAPIEGVRVCRPFPDCFP